MAWHTMILINWSSIMVNKIADVKNYETVGTVTIIELHHTELYEDGEEIKVILCKCACGKEFLAEQLQLKSGFITSCGCNNKDLI
jgi:hypothetical protein